MTTKPSQGTVLPLQYLRGIAAMMGVFHHLKNQIPEFEALLPGTFGASGVDIFFVISGFIMYITTANTSMGGLDFMIRRMIRVVPLYWMLTCVMCLTWVMVPSVFKALVVTPTTLFKSLFFIPHYSLSYPHHIFPLLVPSWTLNFEMFFYVIFALALLLPRVLLHSGVTLLMVVLVLLGAVIGPFDSAALMTYTSPLLLEFAAGVLLGWLWLDRRAGIGVVAGLTLFGLGWALLISNSWYAFSAYYNVVGATLIVGGSLNTGFLNWKNNRLKVLGDATYAIYLSHIFTLGVVRLVWVKLFNAHATNLNVAAFTATAMAACWLVGLWIHRSIEKPLTRYLNQRYLDRSRR